MTDPSAWYMSTNLPRYPVTLPHPVHETKATWFDMFKCLYLFITAGYLMWLRFPCILPMMAQLSQHIGILYSFLSENWTYFASTLAPLTWFISGFLARCLNCPKIDNTEVFATKVTYAQSRNRSSKIHYRVKSFKYHELHRKYPIRLRKDSVFFKRYKTPTHNDRQVQSRLDEWFNQSDNNFQRYEKSRLKACKSKYYASGNHTRYKKQHLRDTRRNYRVQPWNSIHGNLSPKPTACQIHAVTKIATNIHMMNSSLSHDTALKVPLQVPAKFRASVRKGSIFPLIWDSGASVCIKNCKSDFLDFNPNSSIKMLNSVGNGHKVMSKDHVLWYVTDESGMLRDLNLKAYYIPDGKVRFISTSSLLQQYQGETISLNSENLVLSGKSDETTRKSVKVSIHPSSNLPT